MLLHRAEGRGRARVCGWDRDVPSVGRKGEGRGPQELPACLPSLKCGVGTGCAAGRLPAAKLLRLRGAPWLRLRVQLRHIRRPPARARTCSPRTLPRRTCPPSTVRCQLGALLAASSFSSYRSSSALVDTTSHAPCPLPFMYLNSRMPPAPCEHARQGGVWFLCGGQGPAPSPGQRACWRAGWHGGSGLGCALARLDLQRLHAQLTGTTCLGRGRGDRVLHILGGCVAHRCPGGAQALLGVPRRGLRDGLSCDRLLLSTVSRRQALC